MLRERLFSNNSLLMLTTYVALLRGINVGGKNKLPMIELVSLCKEAGCRDVRSYIQSGNVIFTAMPDAAAELSSEISARILERYGYRIPIVLRTREQLEAVVQGNPFLAAGVSEETLHVLFLADLPSAEKAANLDPNRSVPDAFVVRDREVYLHLPNGAADTKLTNAYFDARLGTVSTGRNWRTVTKLMALMVT